MSRPDPESLSPAASGGRVKPRILLALLLLTLGALLLRTIGIGSMLPHEREIDSEIVDEAEALILRGDWEPDEQELNKYPTLLPGLAALGSMPPMAGANGEHASLEEHLEAASALYLRMRWIVLLIAIGAIPGTWLLARRFLPDEWALVAAAFIAVGLIHVDFSAIARPHGAVATLMLASVLASMRMRRAPTVANYALAGLAAGLAIGCLHSGLAILIPLFCAHFLRERAGARAQYRWRLLISLAISAGCTAFFYWNLFEGLLAPAYVGVKGGALQQGEHHLTWTMINGGGFKAMARHLLSADPVLGVMALLGALTCLFAARAKKSAGSEQRDILVVLAAALPYFIVIGLYSRTFARFSIPLYPYYALLAAVATRTLAGTCARAFGLGERRARVICKSLVVALVLAFPTFVCVKWTWLRSRPDTTEEVAAWILQHATEEGVRIALAPGIELPLLYPSEALYHPDGRPIGSGIWAQYQRRIPDEVRDAQAAPLLRVPYRHLTRAFRNKKRDSREVLRATGAKYVIYQHSSERITHPSGRFFFDGLERGYELVQSFAPDSFGDAYKRRLIHIWVEDKARRILEADAFGPELRIYRRRTQ